MIVSDIDLMARIQAGDVGAIGELYDRYIALLFPLSLRIVRDRSEAEDIVHDAFLMVRERAGQFAPDRGSVVAWIVTLVRNLSIDRARRRERRGAIVRQEAKAQGSQYAETPEALTSDASERAKVRRALDKLPEAQRNTLSIAFFEGLSYPEIAEREGVPLGTIKSRAARAIASLREALAAEGIGQENK